MWFVILVLVVLAYVFRAELKDFWNKNVKKNVEK